MQCTRTPIVVRQEADNNNAAFRGGRELHFYCGVEIFNFLYGQAVSPPVMWLMCAVYVHMIARNSATSRSYQEPHICAGYCRDGVYNGGAIRLQIGVLIGEKRNV